MKKQAKSSGKKVANKNLNKRNICIGVVGILIIVLVIVGICFMNNDKDSDNKKIGDNKTEKKVNITDPINVQETALEDYSNGTFSITGIKIEDENDMIKFTMKLTNISSEDKYLYKFIIKFNDDESKKKDFYIIDTLKPNQTIEMAEYLEKDLVDINNTKFEFVEQMEEKVENVTEEIPQVSAEEQVENNAGENIE